MFASQVQSIAKGGGASKEIFPKLPVQLREYYNAFERNKRIKVAMRKTKKKQELLRKYVGSHRPVEEVAASLVAQNADRAVRESASTAAEARHVERMAAAIALREPAMPAAAPPAVPQAMRRSLEAGCIVVNGEPIGAVQGLAPPAAPFEPRRRKGNTCFVCRMEGMPEIVAQTCAGKTNRKRCPNRVPGKEY